MKAYHIEIKPTAENDLLRRYQQIAKDSPENALNWYLRIIDAIEKLDILAERCPIAPEDTDVKKGIRHLVISEYRALYLINGDAVEILHVRHGRMDRKL